MSAVRFLADRGSRRTGEVVRFDDRSAAHLVAEGAAEYVDPAPEPVVPEQVPVEVSPTGVEVPDPDPGFKTASVDDGD